MDGIDGQLLWLMLDKLNEALIIVPNLIIQQHGHGGATHDHKFEPHDSHLVVLIGKALYGNFFYLVESLQWKCIVPAVLVTLNQVYAQNVLCTTTTVFL